MTDADAVLSSSVSLHDWLEAVAADRPLPAGGHVAALAAAFGAALVEKVARILAAAPRAVAHRALAVRTGVTARGLRDDFQRLGGEDDRAYTTLLAARRAERAGGPPSAPAAEGALTTQLSLLEHAVELAALARGLEPIAGAALAADLATARLLAGATAHAAHGNVRANAALAGEDAAARAVETANALLARLEND